MSRASRATSRPRAVANPCSLTCPALQRSRRSSPACSTCCSRRPTGCQDGLPGGACSAAAGARHRSGAPRRRSRDRRPTRRAPAPRRSRLRARRSRRGNSGRGRWNRPSSPGWRTPTASGARRRPRQPVSSGTTSELLRHLVAQQPVERRRVAGDQMQPVRQTARGDVQAQRVAQQAGDLRQRHAQLRVQVYGQPGDPRAELHAGRTQRIGGLQRMPALDAPSALRAVAHLDVEAGHERAHRGHVFLILRRASCRRHRRNPDTLRRAPHAFRRPAPGAVGDPVDRRPRPPGVRVAHRVLGASLGEGGRLPATRTRAPRPSPPSGRPWCGTARLGSGPGGFGQPVASPAAGLALEGDPDHDSDVLEHAGGSETRGGCWSGWERTSRSGVSRPRASTRR